MRSTLAFLLCLTFSAQTAHAQTLRIYHIDVEQASATLLVAPGGRTLLVDSGKNGMGSRIKAVMDQAGVTKIDHFVLTHYHEDHMGGIDDLVGLGVSVLEAYDRGKESGCIEASEKQEKPASTSISTALFATPMISAQERPLGRGEPS